MKRKNPIRDAIDESLFDVRFDAQDARNVMRAIRSREEERRAPSVTHRRFKLDFAFALTLAVIVAAPLSLMFIRSQNMRVITAAPGSATPVPSVVLQTAEPQGDPILETSAQSAVIRAARACFESQCDTSIFSFDEYDVSISEEALEDGTARFTVTMSCIYDNGCSFTCVVAMPSGEIVQHSTPELATTPMFFDDTSDEIQSWYRQYGPYPFTWDKEQQVEFSRRYEGASIRFPQDGEISAQEAVAIAAGAVTNATFEGTEPFAEVYGYPVLYAERANSDGRARYVVYCFSRWVTDTVSDPCVLVTIFADTAGIDSIEVHSAAELSDIF